ncbi:MAG: rhodanese-like domain-containing protein [Chloroflexota bacterium]
MKRVFFGLFAVILAATVAACGGAASTSEVVEPAASAPVIQPDSYIANYSEADHVLLDVRTAGEVASGVIPGAIHIPLNELSSRVNELPQDKTIVVYCNSGNRSRSAVSVLNSAGYTQLLDLGGVVQWQGAGYNLALPGQ